MHSVGPDVSRGGPLLLALRLTWRADRRSFGLILLFSLGGGAAALGEVLVARAVIVRLLATRKPHLFGLLPDVLLITGFGFIMFGAQVLVAGRNRLLSENVVRVAQRETLEVAVGAELEAFDDPEFFDALVRGVRQSVSSVNVALGLAGITSAGLAALGFLALLIIIQPLLAPFVVLGSLPLARATMKTGSELYLYDFGATASDRARLVLQELLIQRRAAPEVRALGIESALLGSWERMFAERIQGLAEVIRSAERRAAVSSLAAASMIGGSFLLLAWLYLDRRLSIAAAITAGMSIQQLGSRSQQAMQAASQLRESASLIGEINHLHTTYTRARSTSVGGTTAPTRLEVLELSDLSFVYPQSTTMALRGVSLTLRRGQVLAVVGENGGGKTTLASLIAGLYTPSAGELRWNGAPYATLDMTTLRQSIAVMSQHYAQFPLTARENILLGVEGATDGDLREAAKLAGADEFIEDLPHRYDTVLSKEFEEGADLSGGQWQRIALARAFARSRASLLILDEPSSSLDPRAEAALFETMRVLAQDRAVVFISHRLATVQRATEIIVLHQGEIVERGSHSGLLAVGGRYRELFELQARQYEADGPSPSADLPFSS